MTTPLAGTGPVAENAVGADDTGNANTGNTVGLREVKGDIKAPGLNSTSDSTDDDNTAIYKGDALIMVLEDFTDELELDMFDLVAVADIV